MEANIVRNIKNCLLFISWGGVFDDEKTFTPHSYVFNDNRMMTLSMLSMTYMGKTRSYWKTRELMTCACSSRQFGTEHSKIALALEINSRIILSEPYKLDFWRLEYVNQNKTKPAWFISPSRVYDYTNWYIYLQQNA